MRTKTLVDSAARLCKVLREERGYEYAHGYLEGVISGLPLSVDLTPKQVEAIIRYLDQFTDAVTDAAKARRQGHIPLEDMANVD